jgi:hypothetical protein
MLKADNCVMTGKKTNHSEGLSFRKMDLHVHTPGSNDFTDKTVTPEAVVEKALSEGLSAIAITDHNSGSWVDEVAIAALGTDLTVFPGVEITCMGGKGGIHVVALFEPTCGKAHIEGLLSELGCVPEKYGDLKTVLKKSIHEVASVIRQRGGLAVLAHANSSSGVISEISGTERSGILQDKNVCAVEATDFSDAVKAKAKRRVVDFLDGSDPNYGKRTLAVYQASDNPDADGDSRQGHGLNGIGSRASFFKVDKINLESLRQSFADPKVRIKQEMVANQYPRITRITVNGGYFDQLDTSLHEGLNTIIGGKGAGKSLIVELLRFALNQPSELETILQDHNGKLRNKLDTFGQVEVQYIDSYGKPHVVKRTFNEAENSPYDAEDQESVNEDMPVLFLSQNEIINIAEDEKAQLNFIDKFFNFRHHRLTIVDLERQLKEWDRKLANCIRASQQAKDVRKLVTSAQQELTQLDQKLKNPVFDKFHKLETKKLHIETQRNALGDLLTRMGELNQLKELTEIEVPVPDSLKDDPSIRRVKDLAGKSKTLIAEGVDALKEQLSQNRDQIESEIQKFATQYDEAKAEYEEQVRISGGDSKALAERRAAKFRELEELRRRLKLLIDGSNEMHNVATQRREVLTKLQDAYKAYSSERQTKIKAIEKAAGGKLKLNLYEGDNKDEFKKRLYAMKRGSYLKETEIDQICAQTDPHSFITDILNYVLKPEDQRIEAMAAKVGLETNRVRPLVEFLVNTLEYEELLELQYKAMPEDRPSIEYNISLDPAAPEYEPLTNLSTGQKCTAMLIIALSDGNIPIVIDQPEDSLDIKSVWEDMCLKVRGGKENRQFLFTTHNSSLAVASDTDKFLVIVGNSRQGSVIFSGSMDGVDINDEVLKYLEGDILAYRLKYEKYNIDQR